MDKICLEELVQLHIVLGWFTQHLPVRLLVSLLMVSCLMDLPPVSPKVISFNTNFSYSMFKLTISLDSAASTTASDWK